MLGFALALALALGLVGVLTGLAAHRQTTSFETELELAEAARVSEFVSGHYGEEYGWPESNEELQMPMEQAAAIAGLHIIMFDAQGETLAGSHDPYVSTGGSSDMGTVSHEPAWRAEEPIRWEPAWDEPEKAFPYEGGGFPVLSDGKLVGSFAFATFSDPGLYPESQPFALMDPEASRISDLVDRYLLWAGIGAAGPGDGVGVSIVAVRSGPVAGVERHRPKTGTGRPVATRRNRWPNGSAPVGAQFQCHGRPVGRGGASPPQPHRRHRP